MTNRNDESGERVGSTFERVSRRRFLGYTGVAGFGGFGLVTADADATFVDDEREIVIGEDEEGPALTEVVPEEWHDRAVRSRRVSEVLRQRFGGDSWVGSVGRRANDEDIDGFSGFDLVVGAKDVRAARRNLPEHVEGFSVEIEEYDEPVPEFCNTNNYSCVPGGAYVRVERNDGEIRVHSGTCFARNSAGDPRYLTCAHGFRDDCGDDLSGNPLWQGSSSNYVGTVSDWDATQDWALIRQAPRSDISGFDNEIIGQIPSHRGWITEAGIDTLISTDETVYKYGARTCFSSGQLTGDQSNNYCGGWVRRGRSTVETDSGDSGAPHFVRRERDGEMYLWLIGPHFGRNTTVDRATMPFAYDINDEHDITFGTTGSNSC